MEQKQQRDIALMYQCAVPRAYITEQYGVSPTTMKRINDQLMEGNVTGDSVRDPLLAFYNTTQSNNRLRNAVHLYLAANCKQEIHLMHSHSYVDKERDSRVIEAVETKIFDPRNEKLVEDTHLDDILTPVEPLKPEEKLMLAICLPSEVAIGQAMPFIYSRLVEAYQIDEKVNLNRVYDNVARDIIRTLRAGWDYAKNPEVATFADKLSQAYVKKVERELGKIAPREMEVLQMRFGKGSLKEIEERARKRLGQVRGRTLKLVDKDREE